jgi:hypothetical protein
MIITLIPTDQGFLFDIFVCNIQRLAIYPIDAF